MPTSLAIGLSVWQNSGQKNVNEMELDHFQIWPIILSNPPSSPLSWLHVEGSKVPRVGPGATRNITGSLNDCMEQFFTIKVIGLLHEWRVDLFWVSLLSWINQSFPCSPLDFYHVKRSPQSVHNLHVFQLNVMVPNYMCSLASWFFPHHGLWDPSTLTGVLSIIFSAVEFSIAWILHNLCICIPIAG